MEPLAAWRDQQYEPHAIPDWRVGPGYERAERYNALLDHFRELSNAVDDLLEADYEADDEKWNESLLFLGDLRRSQREDGIG